MRFTYYAATIFFISTVWAVPVNITISSDSSQIDLHARHSAASSLLQPYIEKMSHSAVKPYPDVKSSPAQGEVLVKSASGSKGKTPVQSTQGKDVVRSKIIIHFWTAERYTVLKNAGVPEWQHINIHNTLCSADQRAELERSTAAFFIHAKNAPGLRIKPSQPIFVFQGECQAQWFPVYNLFDLKVEKGEGGKCENTQCVGSIFLQTGHGLLLDIDGDDGGDGTFYDTTDQTDNDRFNGHHAALRD